MRVLDVGCGPGRHALALARRGIDVVGVDHQPGVRPARPRRGGRPKGCRPPSRSSTSGELDRPGEFDAADLPVPGRLRPARRARRDRGVRPDRAPASARVARLAVSAFSAVFAVRHLEEGEDVRPGDRGAARGRDGAWARGRRARVRPLDHLLHRPRARAAGARRRAARRRGPRGDARAATGDRPRRSITPSCCSSRGALDAVRETSRSTFRKRDPTCTLVVRPRPEAPHPRPPDAWRRKWFHRRGVELSDQDVTEAAATATVPEETGAAAERHPGSHREPKPDSRGPPPADRRPTEDHDEERPERVRRLRRPRRPVVRRRGRRHHRRVRRR